MSGSRCLQFARLLGAIEIRDLFLGRQHEIDLGRFQIDPHYFHRHPIGQPEHGRLARRGLVDGSARRRQTRIVLHFNPVGRDRMLGFSTHNEAQLLASNAEPVDYVAIGPLFETGSKRNPDPPKGERFLPGREAVRRMTARLGPSWGAGAGAGG